MSDTVRSGVAQLNTKTPLHEFLVVLAASICVAAVLRYTVRGLGQLSEYLRRPGQNNEKFPSTFVKSKRQPGTWVPSTFKFPTSPPSPNWSIETTKPLPYRPFKYGPKYFMTMGIRNIKYEDWIELDNQFPRFYHDKRRRIEERGPKACRTLPEAYPAAVELLEELCSYLPARYPTLYERTEKGIKNLWSGEEIDTTSRPLPEDPMQSCGRLTQDDYAILMEKPDGIYYLQAGAILLAGFWRLEDKLGLSLSSIHTSADVPHYEEKLEKSMNNLFGRLKPEELVARNNYTLQMDSNLPWSSTVGPEDSDDIGWHRAAESPAIENHYFRSERQTLRRLPKSGAIVFAIHTYFVPITEMIKEDYVPGRLASAIRSWTDDISRYKGLSNYGDILLKYLDEQHQKQIDQGLNLEEEDEKRRYPY